MTSKIPRCTSLTCEEESVLSIFGRQRVRFARFVGRRVATRDNEVCPSGRLGDRFGRFPGCMNVSASRPPAAGRGKLSGRRRRSSTTNWQKGKFGVIGQGGLAGPSGPRGPLSVLVRSGHCSCRDLALASCRETPSCRARLTVVANFGTNATSRSQPPRDRSSRPAGWPDLVRSGQLAGQILAKWPDRPRPDTLSRGRAPAQARAKLISFHYFHFITCQACMMK